MRKKLIRLTSVTYAVRAQKQLERQGIRSAVRKTARNMQTSGCGYGLEINVVDLDSALRIINASGIRILEITD